ILIILIYQPSSNELNGIVIHYNDTFRIQILLCVVFACQPMIGFFFACNSGYLIWFYFDLP
ncbi:hypothetical protein Q4Q91_13690, partial [Morganella morganii]